MYNIKNKSNIYYVHSLEKNITTLIGDESALINYLVNYYTKVSGQNSKRIEMEYDDINFSGTDTFRYFVWRSSFENSYLGLRKLIILDGENRIIDVRLFEKKVKKRVEELVLANGSDYLKRFHYYYDEKNNDNLEYGDVLVREYWRNRVEYRYRIDPVPCVRKYRGGPYQHKKYRRIIAMILNPENDGYIRKSHYESLLAGAYDWDDYNYRVNEKSWKQNKKCKKQWQKHLV